jgi:hypothetical protein
LDAEGFYRSTDGGANWTRRSTQGDGPGLTIGSAGNGQSFVCVPGNTGHFFWTHGPGGPINPYDPDSIYKILIFSNDGGTTLYTLSGWMEAWALALGKEAPGGSYPTLFVSGWRTGDAEPGIYRCSDFNPATRGGTWTRLADDYGTIDAMGAICGDFDTYGTVYAGLKGSGVIYGLLVTDAGRLRLR